ncbi:uncharacterized [Tachysurus ichikawai]
MTGRTSTIAHVGEPPDVPQFYTEPHRDERILSFIVPLRTISRLDLLHLFQLSSSPDPGSAALALSLLSLLKLRPAFDG